MASGLEVEQATLRVGSDSYGGNGSNAQGHAQNAPSRQGDQLGRQAADKGFGEIIDLENGQWALPRGSSVRRRNLLQFPVPPTKVALGRT